MAVEGRKSIGYVWVCEWCNTKNFTEKGEWCICNECEEIAIISVVKEG